MANIVNFLFFSNFDNQCMSFIGMMRSEGLLQYFHTYCVDNKGYPDGITVVPTLLIRNGTLRIEGLKDVTSWLISIKQWRQQWLLQQQNSEYNNLIGNNLGINNSIIGFNQLEMDAFSDPFALLQSDNALPQTFAEYQKVKTDQSKLLIYTPPTEDTKITEEKQRKMIKQTVKERHEFESEMKKNLNSFLNSNSSGSTNWGKNEKKS